MKTERNYGIDLLRLVLMYMVCVLHSLGQGCVLNSVQKGTAAYSVFWFMEILCFCAVDGFALISGYMATDKPQKYEKIIEMWFQALFYSLVLTVFLTYVVFKEQLSWHDIELCAFPVTYSKFWYFTAYFGLFFFMPVLNKFLFSVSEENAKKLFIIFIILYSVMEMNGRSFKTDTGYSTLWLIVLYCVGALAKRIKLFEQKKSPILVAAWMLCILFTWFMFVYMGDGLFFNYVSPTILLSGLIMVILFSRIKIKGRIVKALTPITFGIYLFHLNQVIWSKIILGVSNFAVRKPLGIGVLCVLGVALAIFVSGLLVDYFRYKLAKMMKIPELSKLIAKFISFALGKVAVLLK